MRYPYSVERKLLDQISANDHFVFTTDLEANITFCNDAFQRVYQIVGESVVGVNIDSLFNAADAGIIKDAIHQALLTKSSVPPVLSSDGVFVSKMEAAAVLPTSKKATG